MGKWGVLKSISLEKITKPQDIFYEYMPEIFWPITILIEKMETAFKMLSMSSIWVGFDLIFKLRFHPILQQ